VSWPTVTLGEVADIVREGVDPQHVPASTRYVGLEHIGSNGELDVSDIVEPRSLASTKFAFTAEHVLFGKLRPYLRKVARPPFAGICSTDIVPIAPTSRLDRAYLFHFLRTDEVVRRATTMSSGANLPRISPRHLLTFPIPLPPVGEQRRIAATLDQADALRRKRQEAQARLGTLINTLFQPTFGDARIAAGAWPTISFDEACADETSRSEKLQRGNYKHVGRHPVVDQGQSPIAGWSDDDGLLCRSELPVVVFGDHTRAVKYVDSSFIIGADGAKVLKPSERYNPLFFALLLERMPLPDLGYSRHMREVKRLAFPAPPRELQDAFAQQVSAIRIEQQQQLRYAVQLDSLFASLQDRAFTGRL